VLKSVHLSNFAIASDVSLHLDPGMTAVTGETGAGKSIMVDALKLICGQRADEGLIKEGLDQSVITATFDIGALPRAQAYARDMGIDDDEIILRRVLRRGARSKSSINGHPVVLSQMEALSEHLLDICGQHSHIQLMNKRHQLEILDRIGASMDPSYGVAIESVQSSYSAWKAAKDNLKATLAKIEESQQQRLLLGYQLEELDELQPIAGEFEEISKEHEVLERAEDDQGSLNSAIYQLEGGHNDDGIPEKIGSAIAYFEDLADRYPELSNAIEMLGNAKVEITEAISEANSVLRGISHDPDRCAQLDKRMSAYFRLSKKHMTSPDELASRHEQIQKELQEMPTQDDIGDLEEAVIKSQAEFDNASKAIRALRVSCGEEIARKINEVLHRIGLEKSRIFFNIVDGRPSESGSDDVEVMFSANVGQSPKPLSKVASGGELSRVALAFQVIEAEYAALPTMIFDEIDVGIGGDAAKRVGEMLSRLGQRGQCLVITHQAPVAKASDHHMMVTKVHGETETTTSLRCLTDSEREQEIIRMTGIDA